ncbi:flagellar calcium-binding protein [Nitzschia inconspicua]|uniref:Flagellar calcium-binding protein n=1 Tax=Nitzschia inconspicua TaxID=303405 RepID=A0A9K3L691_9STRA|nr:flagellar calcium-binding protein [Nitzschia inconspicua]
MTTTDIDWKSFLDKVSTEKDWDEFLAKFPVDMTEEEKAKRAEIFAAFDPNGNGYLSLAEIDKGCRDILGLYELFEAKKAIMRAYQAAKGVGNNSDETGADYVEKNEFRLLLVYLRDYFILWKIFEKIDTGNDARINMDEFMTGVSKIETFFGIEIAEPEAEFAKIDANSGGQLLFDEFADWALKKILLGEDKALV